MCPNTNSTSKLSSEVRLLRTLFKLYYKNPDEPLIVPSIEQREIAIQPLDKEVMIRHLAFKTIEDLTKFILQKVPGHIYYSTAYYERPNDPSMEAKGWKGADLVFDIDADHLNTQNCEVAKNVGVITVECLEDAVQETLKLIDVLEHEFGIGKNELRITFSGHRGFHVHVESDVVKELGQEERREIVEFLHARLFDVSRYVDMKGRFIPAPGMPGIGGRIWRAIEKLLDDKELQDIKDRTFKLRKLRKAQLEKLKKLSIEQELKINVDEVVTLDVKRLIRIPNSLHGKTGLRVAQVSRLDLEQGAEHVLKLAIPRNFRKGMLKILFLRKVDAPNIMGYTVDVRLDEPVKVPTFLGIYLIRRGLACLVDES